MPRIQRKCAKCKCIAIYRITIINEDAIYKAAPLDPEHKANEIIDVQKLCPEHWASFVADAAAQGYSVGIEPLYRIPKQKGET